VQPFTSRVVVWRVDCNGDSGFPRRVSEPAIDVIVQAKTALLIAYVRRFSNQAASMLAKSTTCTAQHTSTKVDLDGPSG